MNRYELLTGLTSGFTPVVDAGFSLEDYEPIDLSVDNKELAEKELLSAEAFEDYLEEFLRKKGKRIAFGGYNEHRGLYRRSQLFSAAEDEELVRNIHLGVDIWAPAGTDVLAVLDGRIHSFKDNNNFGDYGPTVLIEHKVDNQLFHTLYGHLSRASLVGLEVGQQLKKGEKIAELGDPSENGDYAPHLHFQIINNIGSEKGDYPGVASKKELADYLSNCPDPNILLKIG